VTEHFIFPFQQVNVVFTMFSNIFKVNITGCSLQLFKLLVQRFES